MAFKIGDRVKYEEKDVYGEDIVGKIVAISNNNTDMITTYLAELDSGTYIQFTGNHLKWCKVGELVLVA
ncbi:hypothetical protein ACFLXY_08205 [Chloroflexota bacterium]